MPILAELLEYVSMFTALSAFFVGISTLNHPLHTTISMDSPVQIPPRIGEAEVLLGRRYMTAVNRALATPPGNTRMPKAILGALTRPGGVSLEYPTKSSKNCKAQTTPGSSTFQTKVGVGGRRFLLQHRPRRPGRSTSRRGHLLNDFSPPE